ncbi:MAG: glycogen synthase GlgA [Candidatus Eiseniibacteriota bacterium]
MNPLKILFVTAEAAPFAKTGGLADVSASLSRYLKEAGHDVRVVMPLYPRIRRNAEGLAPVEGFDPAWLKLGDQRVSFQLWKAPLPGSDLDVHFIECGPLFDRESIYTNDPDEHRRFLLLSRAAIEIAQRWRWAPDVFHVHDWHAAMVPLYLRTTYAWDRLFARSRTLLSIHNLGHQGVFGSSIVPDLELGDGAVRLHQEDLRAGRINFLKHGLLHADRLSTVSPTYAREIQTEAYGFGLSDLLRARADALTGILNGVDYENWNPRTDRHIVRRYSEKSLHGKERNKEALLSAMGLRAVKGVPVIGVVSRLSAQKGFELVFDALPPILRTREVQFVALGTGEPRYEEGFHRLAAAFPQRVSFHAGYSEPLAHLIEAGSDLFVMPSRYEPCGLNQMYSLKYGTVPVVRRTGGLADTVEPFDPRTGEGTGFLFDHFTAQGLAWALGQALDVYADRKAWKKLMLNGMAQDYSWAVEGPKYVALYEAMALEPSARP